MSDYKIDIRAQLSGFEEIESKINSLKSKPVDIKVNLQGANGDLSKQLQSQMAGATAQFKNAGKNAGNNFAQGFRVSQSQVLKFQEDLLTGKFSANTSKMTAQLKQYDTQSSALLKKAQSYSQIYQKSVSDLSRHFNENDSFKMNDEQVAKSFQNMERAAKTYANTMIEVRNESSKTISATESNTLGNKIQKYYSDNTKAVKEYGTALKNLEAEARSAKTQGDITDIKNRFKELDSVIKSKGLSGKSIFDELGRGFKQIGQFVGTYGVLQQIPQITQAMVEQTVKVDDAMTQLRMATGVTKKEASDLMGTYTDMGKVLKATGVDVAASATEWLKQGKSIQQSQELAQDSIVLSKIGDLSSQDSTKTITAAMKSYNLQEKEVMNFVDQISAIDMASATDVGGLATAFNEVAANARQAGVDTKQLLSYAAVIGETTQGGMASVGTSLNAIFSRMGNVKLSRLKDYETGEDLSNVETVLRGVGIQLRDTQDQFRDFDDVLDDTANRWTSFSGVQQRAVSQAFAGTHHMNDFMILMQQWDKVQEYIKTADNASGESMKKYEAYQDSLSGRFEGLKNQTQEFSNVAANSDFLKGLVDSGTSALDVITQLIDKFGVIGPLVAGFSALKGILSFKKNFDQPQTTGCPGFPIFPGRVYHGGEHIIMAM